MRNVIASIIMRTTIDIDDPILRDLKALQAREGKSLGRLVSDLLAKALAESSRGAPAREFQWLSRPMGARVDLADRDALLDAMDERAP
jgi:hypothetical protein